MEEEQLAEELKEKRICRFCLTQTEPLSDIFSTNAEASDGSKKSTPLTLQIMACVAIEVGRGFHKLIFGGRFGEGRVLEHFVVYEVTWLNAERESPLHLAQVATHRAKRQYGGAPVFA